jgi:hypothetical protein
MFLSKWFSLLFLLNLVVFTLRSEEIVNAPLTSQYNYLNSFKEGVFDLYYNQMKLFINDLNESLKIESLKNCNNPIIIKLNHFILLFSAPLDTVEDKRHFHETMLSQLRDLIQDKINYCDPTDSAAVTAFQYVDSLSKWMYTKPNLLPAYVKFMKSTTPYFSFDGDGKNDLIDLLDLIHGSLENNPLFSNFVKWGMTWGDEHYDGSLPTHVFNAFSIPFVITPRVTIENNYGGETRINPEFFNYLISLKKNNEKHLYINLMNRTETEREASKSIENLSLKSEFNDVLYVVTLDKRSDFYWQRHSYEVVRDSSHFKDTFMCEMFDKTDEESRFKWPEKLNLAAWRSTCETILSTVHRDYFANQPSLTVKQRQDFIDVALIKIIETLCGHLKPNFANVSCKHTVDRGPTVLSLLLIYDCLENKRVFTEENKEQALTIFFAPPLLAQSRPSHNYRLARLKSAIQVLTAKPIVPVSQ